MISAPCGRRMLRSRPRRRTRARLIRCVVRSFATLSAAGRRPRRRPPSHAGRRRLPSTRCGHRPRRRCVATSRPRRPRPGGRRNELDADRAGGAGRHDGAAAGGAERSGNRGGRAAHADARHRQVGGAGRVGDAEARDRRRPAAAVGVPSAGCRSRGRRGVEDRHRRAGELAGDREQVGRVAARRR